MRGETTCSMLVFFAFRPALPSPSERETLVKIRSSESKRHNDRAKRPRLPVVGNKRTSSEATRTITWFAQTREVLPRLAAPCAPRRAVALINALMPQRIRVRPLSPAAESFLLALASPKSPGRGDNSA